MKNLIFTLLVGFPLYSFAQIVTPEAQQLVVLSSDSILDFEFDGQYSYVLTKHQKETELAVYEKNNLVDSHLFAYNGDFEFGKRCDGKIVVYHDAISSVVHVDEQRRITFNAYGPLNYDCFESAVIDELPSLLNSEENHLTIVFKSEQKWDTVSISLNDELNPVIKNPGKSANMSRSDRSNIHDRSTPGRMSYSAPTGEYSVPETRVYSEGGMEDIRRAQYKNGAMTMQSQKMEPLVFIMESKFVVINAARTLINTYSLVGELISSNEISIPRPAVWVKNQEEFVFNPSTQELFFLSRNSSGTQFYSMNAGSGEATAIFSEKKSAKLVMLKPSSEGVAYVVKRKGKFEVKYTQI